MQAQPDDVKQPVKQAIVATFKRVNDELLGLLGKHGTRGGSTAILAWFRGEKITIANVGDCRAYLINAEYKARVLTVDHRLTNTEEHDRIQAKGATIMPKGSKLLLEGSLSLSRAFGDFSYMNYITAEPDIFEVAIEKDHRFLLLASDGLWEVLSQELESGYLICTCRRPRIHLMILPKR
jgi:serine/threonine protein phosphatase PrpC